MQVIWDWPYTDAEYVSRRGWEQASLDGCPFHPEGGCGFCRLGTYRRVEPVGLRVARFWCPVEQRSVSLLPSFMAARLRGTLGQIEAVVAAVEAAGSVEAAVEAVLPGNAEAPVGLACAVRWIRRRVRGVREVLVALATLLPERLPVGAPTLSTVRRVLGVDRVLEEVRRLGERWLEVLAVPLGFRARAPT